MKKGSKHTTAARQKIAEANRTRVRRPWSPESRALAGVKSRCRKGRKTFAGRSHSEQAKRRIALALIAHWDKVGRKQKAPKVPTVDRRRLPETGAKISAALKGRRASATARANMSAARRGRKHSAAHSKAIQAALKGRKLRGLKPSDQQKQKQADAMRRFHSTPLGRETVRRFNESGRKARMKRIAAMTPDQRRDMMEPAIQASRRANPSGLETAAASVLTAMGIEFSMSHRIGRYVADLFVPSKMLVIECDGAFWHAKPGRPEHDAERDAWMRQHGYKALRLPEKTIRSGDHVEVLRQVAG